MSNDRTVKWLHLSDLHFRAGDAYDRNVVLNSLLEDVTLIQEREAQKEKQAGKDTLCEYSAGFS
jgi:hypothetical protein